MIDLPPSTESETTDTLSDIKRCTAAFKSLTERIGPLILRDLVAWLKEAEKHGLDLPWLIASAYGEDGAEMRVPLIKAMSNTKYGCPAKEKQIAPSLIP